MVLPYDFTASRLSRANLDPQLSHCGMIEFHIEELVPGGRDILMLGLKSFTMPKGRTMGKDTIRYLNGAINHPTQVSPTDDLTCVFQDYINGRQREILHQWFDLVFDERTGLSHLASQIKADAHMVLFGQDGVTRATYFLTGLWPTEDPSIPPIDFGSGGFIDMSIGFSCDTIEDESLGSLSAARLIL